MYYPYDTSISIPSVTNILFYTLFILFHILNAIFFKLSSLCGFSQYNILHTMWFLLKSICPSLHLISVMQNCIQYPYYVVFSIYIHIQNRTVQSDIICSFKCIPLILYPVQLISFYGNPYIPRFNTFILYHTIFILCFNTFILSHTIFILCYYILSPYNIT